MFRLKYNRTLDNTIFSRYHLKPVVEDYYKIQDLTFCVADGVTRDDIYGRAVEYPETKQEAEEWIKKYPNPSGAYDAAKIVCETFIKEIEKYSESDVSEQSMKDVTKLCNDALKTINKNRKIDYLKEDYYCCEAVGGKIIKEDLYCFSLGDCHITLLDENYNIIFTTINNHKNFENYLNNVYVKSNKFDWNNSQDRIMIRKEYRNNPSKKYNGNDISYGAFSGEENAEYYVDTYKVDLSDTSYICAYSDGCEPFFESKEKVKELLENLETIEKEGKERTLIVYEKI